MPCQLKLELIESIEYHLFCIIFSTVRKQIVEQSSNTQVKSIFFIKKYYLAIHFVLNIVILVDSFFDSYALLSPHTDFKIMLPKSYLAFIIKRSNFSDAKYLNYGRNCRGCSNWRCNISIYFISITSLLLLPQPRILIWVLKILIKVPDWF